MLRTFRYLILLILISAGYYLFISEYSSLSEKDFLEKEIVRKDIVEDDEEIVQEIKKEDITVHLLVLMQ